MVGVTGVAPVLYDEVRGLLKLQSADPVDTAKTQAAELGLKTDLPRHGYVFSNVGASEIEVDFESETGSYSIPVETGPLARMGAIHVSGDRIFGPKHIGRIGRFNPGDVYDADDITALRRAIIATGQIGSAPVTPGTGNAAGRGRGWQ